MRQDMCSAVNGEGVGDIDADQGSWPSLLNRN